jgi:hypothetical protein
MGAGMTRPRRRCQYCTRELGRFARWLHVYACNACATRIGMGGTPLRPPDPS